MSITKNVEGKKILKHKIDREIDLNIVNGLNIDLNCEVEMLGNKMTIWITEKKEK